jgi:hypothetical protein
MTKVDNDDIRKVQQKAEHLSMTLQRFIEAVEEFEEKQGDAIYALYDHVSTEEFDNLKPIVIGLEQFTDRDLWINPVWKFIERWYPEYDDENVSLAKDLEKILEKDLMANTTEAHRLNDLYTNFNRNINAVHNELNRIMHTLTKLAIINQMESNQ